MNEIEVAFFQKAKSVLPEYQNLAQSVADVLEVSVNEAYKKIRGQSGISLQQLIKLADTFGIPFNYGPSNLPTVTFEYLSIDKHIPNMGDYLNDLLQNLKLIHRSKKKHITITTDDIPVFHFFKYPELTAFKLFFWADTFNNNSSKFDYSLVSEQIIEISQELNQLYMEIPSTEIWAKDTVAGTVEQIRYAFEAGHIPDRSIAEKIVSQVKYCLTDMNMYAIGSKKTIDQSHSFNWLTCDVLGSIAYLVDFEESMRCFNRFNTFNYLKTDDHFYCTQTREWMQGLIKKSVSFSGQGEKHRNKFLYNAFAECDKLIMEINQI